MEEDSVEVMPLPLNHAHGLRTAYAHLLNGSTCLINDIESNLSNY